MFDQIIEFIGNHYILVSVFIALLGAFLYNEGRLGGAVVSPSEMVTLINHDHALVLDIRNQNEFNTGHIVDAKNIPFASIDSRIADLERYKGLPVVIVCKMGQQSGAVGKKLRAAGFENTLRLRGGLAEWTGSNLPLVRH